jgi:hypothetical protein
MKKLFLIATIIMFLSVSTLAEPPWQFIIVGDSRSSSHADGNGVNISIFTEIANEIVRHDVDFVLFPGDLVNGGVDQATLEIELLTWRDIMQPVYDMNIGVYPVRGNHELGNPVGTTAWNNVFSGNYLLPQNGPPTEMNLTYSITHKNVFVLALDQYINSLQVNQAWVDDELDDNIQPNIIAFGHVPAFKVQHSSCLDDHEAERKAFWQSLQDAGCRVYACGHDHFYDHVLVDNNDADPTNDIHQYVIGTGGAPLRDWLPPYDGINSNYVLTQYHHRKEYGYVLVDVSDSEMKFTWYEKNPATGQYEPPIGSVDFDNNKTIDANDLGSFVQRWLEQDCIIGNDFCDGKDLDQSTIVDMIDYGHFAIHWRENLPLEITMTSSNDDAEEQPNGSINFTSSDLELTHDGTTNQTIGIRFNNIPLIRDANLYNAYIQFAVDEITIPDGNPCSLNIYAEDTDNATAFTSTAYNISSRTKTTGINWNPPDWNTEHEAGPDQRTPNLESIIEQVVTRPGWSESNSLVFIIDGSGRRTAESFNGSASLAPRLYLELEE